MFSKHECEFDKGIEKEKAAFCLFSLAEIFPRKAREANSLHTYCIDCTIER